MSRKRQGDKTQDAEGYAGQYEEPITQGYYAEPYGQAPGQDLYGGEYGEYSEALAAENYAGSYGEPFIEGNYAEPYPPDGNENPRPHSGFRVAAGVFDFIGVMCCTVLLVALMALMFALVGWLRGDLTATFAGIGQNINEAVVIGVDNEP
jgi:hypothetical protein